MLEFIGNIQLDNGPITCDTIYNGQVVGKCKNDTFETIKFQVAQEL